MIFYAFRVLVTCVGFIIPAFPHCPNPGVPAFLRSTVPGLSISRGNMSLNTEIRAISIFFSLNAPLKLHVTAKNSGVSSWTPKWDQKRDDEHPGLVIIWVFPPLPLGKINKQYRSDVGILIQSLFRLIDTAQGYHNSEPQVAEAIAQSGIPRSEIFIMTKLHPKYLGYDTTLEAVEMSLKSLNTDYIDLFLIHSQQCDDFLLICGEGKLERR